MVLPVRVIDHTASALLYLVLVIAPLPLGSTEPATVAVWCAVLGVAVVLASLLELRTPQLVFIGLAAVLAAAYGLVLHEQLAAHPWFASPHPIWKETSEMLGEPIAPSVSIVRNQPLFAVGAPLAGLLSFLSGLMLGANRRRAHQILMIIACSGVAYAIYGIALALVDPTTMAWRVGPIPLTSTFSTEIRPQIISAPARRYGCCWFASGSDDRFRTSVSARIRRRWIICGYGQLN